jgi:hypothetical protein
VVLWFLNFKTEGQNVMERKLGLMRNILKNFGIRILVYDETLSGLADYDGGFRSRIFRNHDPRWLEEFLRSMEPAILYLTEDHYGCYYCFFRIDKLPANIEHRLDEDTDRIPVIPGKPTGIICCIGPWLETALEDVDFDGMLQKNHIPLYLKPEVTQYFIRLPRISFGHCWKAMLLTLVNYLADDENKFHIHYRKFDPDDPDSGYSPKQNSFLSMRLIEKLYNNEDALLEAIKAGDTKRALYCMANLSSHRPPRRVAEKTRDSKDYMLALNVLARKAVQNGSVHPIHIHAVSTDFVQRIETAKPSDLPSVVESMIRSYCALVQNHSLGKYSLVVRNVISVCL